MVSFCLFATVIALLIASSYTLLHTINSTSGEALYCDATGANLRISANTTDGTNRSAQRIGSAWDLSMIFAKAFDLPTHLLPTKDDNASSDLDEGKDSDDVSHLFYAHSPRSKSKPTNNSSPTPLETYRAISNVVFGIQVAGSLTSKDQRDYLCNTFKMNNIEGLGLDYNRLKQVICTDIPSSEIPLENQTVADSLQLYNAMLWLQMTFNVYFGNASALCAMFNLKQAAKVGLDANQIMWYICMTAHPNGPGS